MTIDFDGYKAYLATQTFQPPVFLSSDAAETTVESSNPNVSSKAPIPHENDLPSATTAADQMEEPHVATLAEITAMIQTGKKIPGIRDIPNTVLTDQGTNPVVRKRRKPWEKDVDEETIQGGETFGDHRDTIIQQEYPST